MAADSERTCIVCRGRAAKGQLWRVVWEEGRLRLDESQRRPGRGAYLHPARQCWLKRQEAERWERALRRPKGSLRQEDVVALQQELSCLTGVAVGVELLSKTPRKLRL